MIGPADPMASEARRDEDAALREVMLALPQHARLALTRTLSPPQARELLRRWEWWAHEGQLPPPGDWRVWVIRAGRGFGKTRAGAEWVCAQLRDNPKAHVALVGSTADEVHKVMIEGPSGLIAVARHDETVEWRPTSGEVRWPGGAVASVYSASAGEKLRGPQHDAAWCDELAKWPHRSTAWDNLMMGLRVGPHPRAVVTTTPRPTKLMRRVLALPDAVETLGSTGDNPHLPAFFVNAVQAEHGGTALGRQELDGEMIDDLEGALWTRVTIEACRWHGAPPAFDRVVLGVDPPAGVGGDACGIVAIGRAGDTGYVIEDASVAGATPEGWARAVAACAARVGADRVVAESNQGGAMVQSVLTAADNALPVTLVHATRGKVVRAEPVALLYQRGRMQHLAAFPMLEDELCGLIQGGGYQGPGRSPDRADALVWAAHELMLGNRGAARVRGF